MSQRKSSSLRRFGMSAIASEPPQNYKRAEVNTLDRLRHSNVKIPLAICGGMCASVLVGLLIGSAEFTWVKRVAFMLLISAYTLFWQAHTWKVALAICCLGFSHIGFGFKLGVIELSGIVAMLLAAVSWWRKQHMTRPAALQTPVFRLLHVTLLSWLIYSGCHALYTIMDPFNPYEFALKNFLKTVVAMSGPAFLLFYFMHRPRGIVAGHRLPANLVMIGLITLVANIAIRLWGIFHGAYNLELAASLGDEGGYFEIPVVDLVEGPYTLRSLTLFTATTAAVLLSSDWLLKRTAGFRLWVYVLLLLSFVGAALSGGRATVVFAFTLTGIALWLRGHYRVVSMTVCCAVLIAIVLNLIPGVLQSVPHVLQRSLQMVVLTDESEYARVDISGSSAWRWELVQRAYHEWRSDPRIFWFGRGTYKFGTEDLIAQKLNPAYGHMETSLRRGTTHSLVTDLLVVYGLCGLLIYVCMIATLLWFLWSVYKHLSVDEVGKLIALVSFILLTFLTVYGIVGGANLPIDVVWLIIALIGYLYGRAANEMQANVSELPSGRARTDALRSVTRLKPARLQVRRS